MECVCNKCFSIISEASYEKYEGICYSCYDKTSGRLNVTKDETIIKSQGINRLIGKKFVYEDDTEVHIVKKVEFLCEENSYKRYCITDERNELWDFELRNKELDRRFHFESDELDMSDRTPDDALGELVALAQCYVYRQTLVADKATWLERINRLSELVKSNQIVSIQESNSDKDV